MGYDQIKIAQAKRDVFIAVKKYRLSQLKAMLNQGTPYYSAATEWLRKRIDQADEKQSQVEEEIKKLEDQL